VNENMPISDWMNPDYIPTEKNINRRKETLKKHEEKYKMYEERDRRDRRNSIEYKCMIDFLQKKYNLTLNETIEKYDDNSYINSSEEIENFIKLYETASNYYDTVLFPGNNNSSNPPKVESQNMIKYRNMMVYKGYISEKGLDDNIENINSFNEILDKNDINQIRNLIDNLTKRYFNTKRHRYILV
jgi:hypothetical protein